MTTKPIINTEHHKFILVPPVRDWEPTIHYEVFRGSQKVAKIALDAYAKVSVTEGILDTADIEEDITLIFGIDDFEYVSEEEAS